MNILSEYIKSIISIAFYAFISQSVCIGVSKNKTLSKSLSLIINLCVFLVTISPLFSMIQVFSADNYTFNKQIETYKTDNEFLTLTKAQLEENVREQILINTGILTDNVCIELVYKDEGVEIKSVDVTVINEHEAVGVTEYLTKTFGEKTTIKIMVKQHD